ncbi:MAG: TonB-dependent receptor domain-containing protein, partial [Parvibaculales bacterium]
DTYTQFLPSFNVRWEPWDNHIFRFGAAKTMARPELDNFSLGLTGGSIPVNALKLEGRRLTVGNPYLGAEVSKNMDVGYEWYITKETAFAVAGFYRKFDNYIERGRDIVTAPIYDIDFSGTGPGVFADTDGDGAADIRTTVDIEVQRLLNKGRLEMKGFEVAVQSPLSFLPGILSNLGMTANYTYVESSRNDFTGRSRDSYNWRIYYDTRKLDVRLSYTFRDTYTTRLAAGDVPRVAVNKRSYITVGITYRVRKGVRLLIRASNVDESLTGVPDWRIYEGLDGAYNRVIDFGSRYSVGLKINL